VAYHSVTVEFRSLVNLLVVMFYVLQVQFTGFLPPHTSPSLVLNCH